MSTISMKKTCLKCKGTGIVTCDGCYNSFCHKHLSEHREELLQRMDKLSNQCEQFRKNLHQKNDASGILTAIDQWEQESIEKIHSAAETARADVKKFTERTVNNLTKDLDQLTTNMGHSRETNDTTEVDLDTWTEQLQTLQNLIKQSFSISLTSDENQLPPIHFIKVKYQSPHKRVSHIKVEPKQRLTVKNGSLDSRQLSTTIEKFHQVAGHATLSDDGLMVTSYGYSSVSGIKLYGMGLHEIRFKIISKKNEGIFFGIMTSMQDIIARASELQSVYGWRDFDRAIINGNAQLKAHKEKHIHAGDLFTLTVDCDHAKLSLTHHHIKQKVQMPININNCPRPWKLLVTSYGEDVISIIH